MVPRHILKMSSSFRGSLNIYSLENRMHPSLLQG